MALAFVTRYETRLQRTFHQSIDRLEKMQRDRGSAEEAQKVQNEPKTDGAEPPREKLQNEPKASSLTPVMPISQNKPNDSQVAAPSMTSDTIDAPDECRCA